MKETMTKKMLIDATHAEETRVVVLDGNKVDEFDFESLNKRQLAGNIYLAKVTRVEPSLQAAFVDYGGNRHGFLAFSEIHPDYYQIPKADREALIAEEAAFANEAEEEPAKETREASSSRSRGGKSRSRRRSQPAEEGSPARDDAVIASEVIEIPSDDAPVAAQPAGSDTSEAGNDVAVATEPGSSLEATLPPAFEAAPEADGAAETSLAPGSEGPGEAPAAAEIEEAPQEQPAEAAADATAEADGDDDSGDDAEADDTAEAHDEYESVGGQDHVHEERPVRKPRPRRYKIQEVIKVRQILLVQVIKEERGNKGAALTTYLSLAGRYCVLMPNTARGGGISRKITNAADRKKLKEISASITVPEGAGLIIRTAGANRTKTEIRRDYEYLLRQWEQIRELTLKSIAPCLIYEEGSLVKRAIRDLYSRDIDEVLVDGERGYREAKDYMKMLMPSHAKNVKHYSDALPLFSRFQVESYLAGMFNPVVQLKSGGYIVIDVTEALVAIDVNSGRATREASIEDTALKTNLEAAEEAARQMRLRDLAGLIVIDFIDMDERKNNAAVEKKLKDKLKTDRARIQVGRISGFGLLEMSRQRLRPGMIEATTKSCPHCHGTGRVRSNDSVALALLREIEEEGVRQRSKEVLIVAPVEIANYLLNQKREHITMVEARFGLSVRVEGDAAMISPDYRLERFKTASRIVTVPEGTAVMAPIVEMDDLEEPEVEEEETAAVEAETSEETVGSNGNGEEKSSAGGKKKRRRRRRGGSKNSRDEAETQNGDATSDEADANGGPEDGSSVSEQAPEPVAADADSETPAKRDAFGEVIDLEAETGPEIVSVPESDSSARPSRRRRVSQPAAAVIAEAGITLGEDGPAPDEATPEAAPSAEPVAAETQTADEIGHSDAPEEDAPRAEVSADPVTEAFADPAPQPVTDDAPQPVEASSEAPVPAEELPAAEPFEPAPEAEETAEAAPIVVADAAPAAEEIPAVADEAEPAAAPVAAAPSEEETPAPAFDDGIAAAALEQEPAPLQVIEEAELVGAVGEDAPASPQANRSEEKRRGWWSRN